YIQQTMQISAMWNHQIDLNLIYAILQIVQGKVDQTITHLSAFEAWKIQQENIQKYKETKTNLWNDVAAIIKLIYFVLILQKRDF
ncbi:hypothetical protein RFI_32118, partial [Reticulomyxa filosa]